MSQLQSTKAPRSWTLAVLVAGLALCMAVPAMAQPVLVDIQLSGPERPNGRLNATAAVEITNGSQIQSYAWTQIGGLTAKITNANAKTARIELPPQFKFKQHLLDVLVEAPIGPEDLPPNIDFPEGEFVGGSQDRWQVLGVNHLALEEAGLITIQVVVTTTSGKYKATEEIHVELPWHVQTSMRNVPVDVPLLVRGKLQNSYDWTMMRPAGSQAKLFGNSEIVSFTPDVPGKYTLKVTDLAAAEKISIEIYAGTWRGVIVGQDMDGRPISDGSCTICHREGGLAPDYFPQWAATGHAEIFTDNLNTSTHYGSNCFECHTVGFNPEAENDGVDDTPQYQAFLKSGLLNNPGDNWTKVLKNFPEVAMKANIQCENCHGPQNQGENFDTNAHGAVMGDVPDLERPRISLSADVCGSCHGEPLRHSRFQQWQLSPHANYELAIDEGGSGNCSRCHTANGFLAWLPVLKGEKAGDPLANIKVDWTTDETHPQTCVTCHDPHNIGTTSGLGTNAELRISGNTPDLIAGFKVIGAGDGAICMTCHNSRRGLRNDATFAQIKADGDTARASHPGPQTDVLMGENAYMVPVGVRGRHSFIEDTCVQCHMERTPPPDLLSYNLGGTNHTFRASPDICSKCHEGITAEGLQDIVETVLEDVAEGIGEAYVERIEELQDAGWTVSYDGTKGKILRVVEFGESHGAQAIAVELTNSKVTELVSLNDIELTKGPDTVGLVDMVPDDLLKAGWNYTLIHNDGSLGVHNPTFSLMVLDAARDIVRPGEGGDRLLSDLYPDLMP